MNFHTRDPRPGAQRPMPGINTALQYRLGRPPVGIWTFAEAAGNLVIDHGPLANHGALIGGPKRVAARDGHAVELDGLTQYISVPHTAALMPKRLTVAVKTRNLVNPAEFDVILMKCGDSNWTDGFGLHYSSPTTVVKFFVGHFSTGGIAQVSMTPAAETILVGTYDGAAVRLFANGAEGTPASYSGGITANTGPLEFGRGRSDSFNIHGQIHWVQLFDHALPPEEARLLSAGVNPWEFMNPLGPFRIRPAHLYGTALNLTGTSVAGDGITRVGAGDGIVRSGGRA